LLPVSADRAPNTAGAPGAVADSHRDDAAEIEVGAAMPVAGPGAVAVDVVHVEAALVGAGVLDALSTAARTPGVPAAPACATVERRNGRPERTRLGAGSPADRSTKYSGVPASEYPVLPDAAYPIAE
jgi:hypothetical protein